MDDQFVAIFKSAGILDKPMKIKTETVIKLRIAKIPWKYCDFFKKPRIYIYGIDRIPPNPTGIIVTIKNIKIIHG